MEKRALSPQEKKQYLLAKYTKRDYSVEDIESCKKYALYFNPAIDKVKEWNLVCVTGSLSEAKAEISWRRAFHTTNDADIVLDHDNRFSTWRDETKNIDPSSGKPYEPGQELMNINYDSPGNMLQVIANSAPQTPQKNGFLGMAHYANIDLDYHGFYKIVEYYEV